MGRKKNFRYGPRLIDIDIIFFKGEEIEEFKPSGAAEIRQAGYEFDKMRKRIIRHLN